MDDSVILKAIDTLALEIKGLKGNMEQRFDKIDQRFEKMDQRFDKMDQRFDKVELEIKEVKKEIVKLREDVTGLQNEKFEIRRIKLPLFVTIVNRYNLKVLNCLSDTIGSI